MKYVDTLASYLPSLIVQHLIDGGDEESPVPHRQMLETVCVFCDVSGFTALSEAMARNGKGAEGLAKHLNSYFAQMVRIIASEGGDVFKFAGDAMIVLWPPLDESLDIMVRRATQCAISIQSELHQADLEEGVQLSVKIGIGLGKISVLHVGGVFKRMEYIAVGDPLLQVRRHQRDLTLKSGLNVAWYRSKYGEDKFGFEMTPLG
jgi:class 3 adenylate cyclase